MAGWVAQGIDPEFESEKRHSHCSQEFILLEIRFSIANHEFFNIYSHLKQKTSKFKPDA
jgi:hypothetical protein